MSEENKQKPKLSAKGGAHVAKSGSKVSAAAQAAKDAAAEAADMQADKAVDTEAVAAQQVASAEPTAVETPTMPKRNKYADKMNKKKRRLNRGVRMAIGIAILLLLIAGGVFLVWKTRDTGTETTGETTAVATRGMLETYIEGSGVTAAKKREELGRDLKGTITSVLVEVGSEVKEGDELVVVNPTETRKELQTAQTELTEAQRAVTDAQAEVSSAQSTLNAARNKLNKLNVTEPFTGKIIPASDGEGNETTYRVGQQVSEGEVIGYMVDNSTMKLSQYFAGTSSPGKRLLCLFRLL